MSKNIETGLSRGRAWRKFWQWLQAFDAALHHDSSARLGQRVARLEAAAKTVERP